MTAHQNLNSIRNTKEITPGDKLTLNYSENEDSPAHTIEKSRTNDTDNAIIITKEKNLTPQYYDNTMNQIKNSAILKIKLKVNILHLMQNICKELDMQIV